MKGLKEQSGWVDLLDFFRQEYHTAFRKLVEGENTEARATIKVIEQILHQLDDKIKLGEVIAKKEFDKRTKQLQDISRY